MTKKRIAELVDLRGTEEWTREVEKANADIRAARRRKVVGSVPGNRPMGYIMLVLECGHRRRGRKGQQTAQCNHCLDRAEGALIGLTM